MAVRSDVLAFMVVDELVRDGVRDFVYCPGSRNGLIGFALHRAADRGEIGLHVRLDERSAAFVAIGLAKGSGRPTAVVTTSGTAVANVLPAVCEANYGRVPLVVLSANRPPEAQGTGASQTIEQFAFFDGQLVHKVQIGSTQACDQAVNADVRGQVTSAVLAAQGGLESACGPVQIDLPLASGVPPSTADVEAPQGRPGGLPWIAADLGAVTEGQGTTIDLSVPTVVVAGDGADTSALPPGTTLVAEPTVDTGGLYRTHPWTLEHLDPKQVVVLGRPTLHRQVQSMLARPGIELFVQARAVRNGIFSPAHARRFSECYRFTGESPSSWLAEVAESERTVRECWRRGLDRTEDWATGLHVARQVLRACGPGDVLWLGASNPVRDISLVGDVPDGTSVHSNRGVAGIDGTLGSAVGTALSCPERRVVALVGDLTFLHDAASLQFGKLEQRPDNLVVVVANDVGGGIFETLEQGSPHYKTVEFGDAFERLYGTPQDADIGGLCTAYRVRHRIARANDLDLGEGQGFEVVEVPTQRATLRALLAEIREEMYGVELDRSMA